MIEGTGLGVALWSLVVATISVFLPAEYLVVFPNRRSLLLALACASSVVGFSIAALGGQLP